MEEIVFFYASDIVFTLENIELNLIIVVLIMIFNDGVIENLLIVCFYWDYDWIVYLELFSGENSFTIPWPSGPIITTSNNTDNLTVYRTKI